MVGVRRGEVRLVLQEAWLYVFDGPGLRRPPDGDELRGATAKSIGEVFSLEQSTTSIFPILGALALIGQCRQYYGGNGWQPSFSIDITYQSHRACQWPALHEECLM